MSLFNRPMEAHIVHPSRLSTLTGAMTASCRQNRFFSIPVPAMALAMIACALPVPRASAQAPMFLTIVHSFGSAPNDGLMPNALYEGSDDNIYGTTFIGGPADDGTVFKMTPSGAMTTLHSFWDGSVSNDGQSPCDRPIQGSNGNLYGTAELGGSTANGNQDSGYGVAFMVTPSGVMTILHSFGDGSVANDGQYPGAGLIQGSDGNFYGTTTGGGSAGGGTVFTMTPSGVVTILHSFGDGSVPNDGMHPWAGLVQGSDGSFYGATGQGGSAGVGTVFTMTSSGAVTILHSFGDGSISNDGEDAENTLIQGSDGNLYGTTLLGGSASVGAAFKITQSGVLTILHSFGDGSVANDGQVPEGLIQGTDGSFYGTCTRGGSTATGSPQSGYGAAFKITPSGLVTILHSFGDGSVPDDGIWPSSGLMQDSDGTFYGSTESGGSVDWGTVFALIPVPKPPTGLVATAGNAQVSLAWTASTGATSYDIYRGTSSGGEGTGPIGAGTATSYTDTGLANGHTYFYEVAAVNPAGTSGVSNEASATPESGLQIPPAPAGLAATAGNGQVSLTWEAVMYLSARAFCPVEYGFRLS
ncbi:MAG: choice-of-anchor tandem repeat GloVer-containing protein, partial [Capsulimonadaceae bacterium]